ncbi:hypothetical protein DSM03_101980 [Leeuwenhoekiella aestuarii]|uniref:Serine aminopeptidase S33 domain-containing protein n=1 Tax=Leeuwenhoekiella aestuarii TaxID=2249426 RepID=A0A4Q0P0I8_9FLAO|nr:alpha/beta hydrolase [Leeuwenhoekiella aestuarii]RXG18298.1 hypothetical protein DSM04_101491 [Leeuwenhoekiella aestuarii]RXG19603.1 hypothetical protein DSM03_101980 [Leeuwenhoekiella aestuarii]
MKKQLLLSILILLVTTITFAQNITGDWYGALKVQGIELPLIFHITETDSAYTATMDSPDQKGFGIPVTTTHFISDTLKLELKNLGATYKGVLADQRISGTFIQMGNSFPLDLGREALQKEPLKRPQEPQAPFPYATEEVVFHNETAAIDLGGTLTLPEGDGNFPAVILISGSGPQDRNEEILGHKPFLVIADYLTRHGIAVLRYDDRGVGKSKGFFSLANSADFATDVEAAMAYLKTRQEIDSAKIGLVGHSEGGLIAPMVAADSKDVGFIVLLAGTGIRGDLLLLKQEELIARASGLSEERIAKSKLRNKELFFLVRQFENQDALKEVLADQINAYIDEGDREDFPEGMNQEAYVNQQVSKLANPWMMYFLKHNPAADLQKVTCPVLAVNGSTDLQVPATENLSAIKAALEQGGNQDVSIKEYTGLNHLFQESETGAPGEYGVIEQTFSPLVLKEITDWILQKTN